MTSSDQLREEARLARESLVATVGELGDTVQLAKAEGISAAKRYGPIAAGVLLFFSVFCLLIALIWAIGEFLPIWAGALIVMFVFIAIAGLLAFIGLRKAKAAGPPIPEKAIETVQPLPDEIKEAAHT